jgi:hypothetical protein
MAKNTSSLGSGIAERVEELEPLWRKVGTPLEEGWNPFGGRLEPLWRNTISIDMRNLWRIKKYLSLKIKL